MSLAKADISIPTPQDFSQVDVFLQTVGRGTSIEAIAGHSLLRFSDQRTKRSYIFNWGVFDFRTKGFLLNFIKGHMRYFTTVMSMPYVLKIYEHDRRSLVEDKLALSESQKRDLFFRAVNDLKEENLYYDYHMFRENCATKIRDHIDVVLGGQIRDQFATLSLNRSLRGDIHELTAFSFAFSILSDLFVGYRVDQNITAWERMYLPSELRYHLGQLNVFEDTHQYLDFPDPSARSIPSSYLLLLFWSIVFAVFALRRPHSLTPFKLYGLWSGTLGLFMVFFWIFTDHDYAWGNIYILLFFPSDVAYLFLSTSSKMMQRFFFWHSLVHIVFLVLVVLAFVLGMISQNLGYAILPFSIMILGVHVWMLIRCRQLGFLND